jgi:hypothetical protein
MPYRGECGRCGTVIFTAAKRVGDVEANAMLVHLWENHPDVVRQPGVLALAELLRLVHVRMD